MQPFLPSDRSSKEVSQEHASDPNVASETDNSSICQAEQLLNAVHMDRAFPPLDCSSAVRHQENAVEQLKQEFGASDDDDSSFAG